MDDNVIKGKWHQLRGEVKRRWGKITDSDYTETEGDFEKLSGKIQEIYGTAKDGVKEELYKIFNVGSDKLDGKKREAA